MSGDVLTEIEAVLRRRLEDRPEGSYSLTLLTDSVQAQRKIMEEAFELCLEVGSPDFDADRIAAEAADLIFHLLAALVGVGVAWDDVIAQLRERRR